jgi:starch phosphorylase
MAEQYLELAYIPGARRAETLSEQDARRARELADWKRSLAARWEDIRIDGVEASELTEAPVDSKLPVRARVFLGRVQPAEVAVEAFYGPIDGQRQVADGRAVRLHEVESDGHGGYVFAGEIPLDTTGMLGYGIRVVPHHPDLHDPYEMRLIRWA